MYSLVNQAKTPRSEDEKEVEGNKEKSQDIALKKKTNNGGNSNVVVKEQGNLGFVKVNVDGMAIGRKVDLNAHSCYETLAQTLEDMFFRPGMTLNLNGSFSSLSFMFEDLILVCICLFDSRIDFDYD